MSHLFDPLALRGVILRNRIGVSAMGQASAVDGHATDWHLVHLGSRALGGAGLVTTESAAVEARGRITKNDLGIWRDGHIPGLQRITDFIRLSGAVPAIQLAHAGPKASHASPHDTDGKLPGSPLSVNDGGWRAIGPSAMNATETSNLVLRMTTADIATVVDSFAQAAKRAQAARFDWIQVHAAHGYLFHSFLSPLSNQRTDFFGGSLDNRARLLRETVRAVRANWIDAKVLSVRISYTDWAEGGWTLQDSISLARLLKEDGVDIIDASSGGLITNTTALTGTGPSIPIGPGYQVVGAKAIRTAADIAVAAVGLITEPQQADDIIRDGHADLVMLARVLLRDPYWPLHAAKVLGYTQATPIPAQYALGWRDQGDFTLHSTSSQFFKKLV